MPGVAAGENPGQPRSKAEWNPEARTGVPSGAGIWIVPEEKHSQARDPKKRVWVMVKSNSKIPVLIFHPRQGIKYAFCI
jgi:hypothetical protein